MDDPSPAARFPIWMTGMHWTIRGVDPVLALRTLHQSGQDQFLFATPQA